MVSLPAPALRTSIPPLPISMSSPAPATNISLPLEPVRILEFLSPRSSMVYFKSPLSSVQLIALVSDRGVCH
jgi:hypothetical protein